MTLKSGLATQVERKLDERQANGDADCKITQVWNNITVHPMIAGVAHSYLL